MPKNLEIITLQCTLYFIPNQTFQQAVPKLAIRRAKVFDCTHQPLFLREGQRASAKLSFCKPIGVGVCDESGSDALFEDSEMCKILDELVS